MRLYRGPNRDLVMGGAAMMVAGAGFYINAWAGPFWAALVCIGFGAGYMFLGYFGKKEATP